jgi:hypothetical protein
LFDCQIIRYAATVEHDREIERGIDNRGTVRLELREEYVE